ncbi:unnamed protein product [Trifolium pratense]|uniref:Uncharacterized protein n=1 Tax=Trifolium pratense TaxID=57577 RepID=A0ACB0K8X9_TRIPR|nr:unnamed protein product [Trifolium pratense]
MLRTTQLQNYNWIATYVVMWYLCHIYIDEEYGKLMPRQRNLPSHPPSILHILCHHNTSDNPSIMTYASNSLTV